MTCEKAFFTADGLPANLPAAACDGYVWLAKMLETFDAGYSARPTADDREKLRRCVKELERFLAPHMPLEMEGRE